MKLFSSISFYFQINHQFTIQLIVLVGLLLNFSSKLLATIIYGRFLFYTGYHSRGYRSAPDYAAPPAPQAYPAPAPAAYPGKIRSTPHLP